MSNKAGKASKDAKTEEPIISCKRTTKNSDGMTTFLVKLLKKSVDVVVEDVKTDGSKSSYTECIPVPKDMLSLPITRSKGDKCNANYKIKDFRRDLANAGRKISLCPEPCPFTNNGFECRNSHCTFSHSDEECISCGDKRNTMVIGSTNCARQGHKTVYCGSCAEKCFKSTGSLKCGCCGAITPIEHFENNSNFFNQVADLIRYKLWVWKQWFIQTNQIRYSDLVKLCSPNIYDPCNRICTGIMIPVGSDKNGWVSMECTTCYKKEDIPPELRTEEDNEAFFEYLQEEFKNTKLVRCCPECGKPHGKDGGCNHVYCLYCGHESEIFDLWPIWKPFQEWRKKKGLISDSENDKENDNGQEIF